jgi:nitrate reductase alpha subunit
MSASTKPKQRYYSAITACVAILTAFDAGDTVQVCPDDNRPYNDVPYLIHRNLQDGDSYLPNLFRFLADMIDNPTKYHGNKSN